MRAELLAEIRRYVAAKISINDLQGWLVAHLQTILESRDQTAVNIANQLDVDLIHLTEGIVSEQTLWEHLVDTLREHDPVGLPESIIHRAVTSSSADDFEGQLSNTQGSDVFSFVV